MDWDYDSWASGEPYSWGGAARGTSAYDAPDFHVDLGAGTVKKGRIGIDQFPAPGVNVVMNLNTLAVHGIAPKPNEDAGRINEDGSWSLWHPGAMGEFLQLAEPKLLDYRLPPGSPGHEFGPIEWGLPFDTSSIESVVSHHCLEHIGAGFIPLIEEVYRVLKPGGIFRAITPLYPSRSSVDDPTHVRMFTETTWEFCCGRPGEGGHWMESFSVPYTRARFTKVNQDVTAMLPPHERWTDKDAREIRVALRAEK